jgi:membrane-bound lytic murein transglycosylase B
MASACLLRVGCYVLVVLCVLAPTGVALAWSWEPLVDRLVEDGFSREEMRKLFARPELAYNEKPLREKLRSLYRRDFGSRRVKRIQTALQRKGFAVGKPDGHYGPMTAAAIKQYQTSAGLEPDGFPSPALENKLEARDPGDSGAWTSKVYDSARHPPWLAEARAFGIEHRPHFLRMYKEYGVPPEIVGGIITIETRQGTFLGGASAMAPLASMALGQDFQLVKPMFKGIAMGEEQTQWLKQTAKVRSDWAYNELKALLEHARDLGRDPLDITGSPYGAIGIVQFMPSNIPKHGVDGDKDGRVDLFTPADAIHSAGRYIRDHGWSTDTKSLDDKRKVVFGYNHSQTYVNSVLAVAGHLEKAFASSSSERPPHAVRVRTVQELLAAIRPGAHVVLESGVYDLARARHVRSQSVRWLQGGAVVFNTADLSLEAEERALILGLSTAAPALHFIQCPGLRLQNLAFGPPDLAMGLSEDAAALLVLEECPGARLDVCLFQGGAGQDHLSAVPGVQVKRCVGLELRNSMLQGSGGSGAPALSLEHSPGALLRNVVFRDNPAAPLVAARDSAGTELADCLLQGNGAPAPFAVAAAPGDTGNGATDAEQDVRVMFALQDNGGVLTVINCLLRRNDYEEETDEPRFLGKP